VKTALAVGLLWGALAFGEDPKSSKVWVSGNGTYGIRMVEVSKDQCRVEVTKESEPAWQVDKCVGGPDDFYLVSNEGTRFWVLRSTPEKPGPPKGRAKGTPWYQVEVATLYDAQANPVQSRRLMDLVPPKDREKVRQLGKHFVWLEGVGELPGKKPRVTEAGQVEFEVAGAKTVKLNF
jgi:hypothetical protein